MLLAIQLRKKLFLTHKSYVFCQYPWNSKLLDYIVVKSQTLITQLRSFYCYFNTHLFFMQQTTINKLNLFPISLSLFLFFSFITATLSQHIVVFPSHLYLLVLLIHLCILKIISFGEVFLVISQLNKISSSRFLKNSSWVPNSLSSFMLRTVFP